MPDQDVQRVNCSGGVLGYKYIIHIIIKIILLCYSAFVYAYYNILYRLILSLALVLVSTLEYFYARRICSFDFAFTASMVKYRNADGVSHNSVIIYNYNTSTRITIM